MKLLGNCEQRNIEQYAILLYTDANDSYNVTINEYARYGLNESIKCGATPIQTNVSLNHPNSTCYRTGSKEKCSADLGSLNLDKSITEAIPDERFYLAFNNYMLNHNDIFKKNVYQQFMSEYFLCKCFFFH